MGGLGGFRGFGDIGGCRGKDRLNSKFPRIFFVTLPFYDIAPFLS
jgi:hypothetical protein